MLDTISNIRHKILEATDKLNPVVSIAVIYGIPALVIVIFLLMWRSRAARTVVSYIGQLEKKGNGGFDSSALESDMRAAGWYKGAPWCAFFAKMVYLKSYPMHRAAIEDILTGSVVENWRKAQNDKTGTFKTSQEPSKGAIVCFKTGEGGHTGIVISLLDGGIETVEGNTSSNIQSRDGEGVFRKTHKFNDLKGWTILGYISLK